MSENLKMKVQQWKTPLLNKLVQLCWTIAGCYSDGEYSGRPQGYVS